MGGSQIHVTIFIIVNGTIHPESDIDKVGKKALVIAHIHLLVSWDGKIVSNCLNGLSSAPHLLSIRTGGNLAEEADRIGNIIADDLPRIASLNAIVKMPYKRLKFSNV